MDHEPLDYSVDGVVYVWQTARLYMLCKVADGDDHSHRLVLCILYILSHSLFGTFYNSHLAPYRRQNKGSGATGLAFAKVQ